MSGVRQWLGSVVFTLYLCVSAAAYAFVLLPTVVMPRRVTYAAARSWSRSVLFMLRWLCGLDYVVEGLENLPATTSVVLVKHSSAWETVAQLQIFPSQTWVLKRELIWIPVFGWVLRNLKPIAIDRKAGRTAVQRVLDQGRQRLAEGVWVVIFPEGTRVPAGEKRRYGMSGALLAEAAGVPVVPVAHNAGDYWPRRRWLKRPGTIRVVIGPVIPTAGIDSRLVTEQAQRWIEDTLATLRAP
ncbi:MAG: lysophospholipid acyltransferase family protein [Gammaproteobacteria bacterium]